MQKDDVAIPIIAAVAGLAVLAYARTLVEYPGPVIGATAAGFVLGWASCRVFAAHIDRMRGRP